MSGVEWKPGDVAMVTAYNRAEPYRAYYDGRDETWRACDGAAFCVDEPTTLRPLVVIDPEDRDQITSLVELLIDNGWRCTSAHGLRDALREFANPTPPKPAEPTGLGAVVEVHGRRWVYTGDRGQGGQWWYSAAEPSRWSEFDSVTVLSEGVTL